MTRFFDMRRMARLTVFFLSLTFVGVGAAHAACDPTLQCCAGSGSGATCGGDGVASQGNTSGTNQGAGNPINVITGNKYQKEVDLPALPGELGLEIIRHYNSQASGLDSPNGILGRGWKLSYETDLYIKGNTLEIVQGDGTSIVFGRSFVAPNIYHPASPMQGKVIAQKTPQGTEYIWTWSNGRQFSFNAAGKLVQIAAPSGEFVSLQRDARGWLVKVTDPQGRSLVLNYLDKKTAQADKRNDQRFRGVQSIDSPVGRFHYEYGNELPAESTVDKTQLLANLVKVGIPTHYDAAQKLHPWANRGVSSSSISRFYHYEDPRFPTLLTGISVSGQGSDGQLMNQRIVTWRYDSQGRANLSVKGEIARYETGADGKPLEPRKLVPGTGVEQVTLQWLQKGQTVLTNSLGQQTTYKTAYIAGEPRILEIIGPGCASCGPSNVRYGYDTLGRLTEETTLDKNGKPVQSTRTELDGNGRVIAIRKVNYRDGKPGPSQLVMRYEYPPHKQDELPGSQPVLIARPSVVPGKEYLVRIAYNDARQPLTVTESGWSPAVDGSRKATVIVRTTTYGYATINGRSLLTQIDGALPNGPTNSPEDSDISRFDWDAKGNTIIAMTVPGNVKSTVRYDEASRVAEASDMQGRKTVFTYDTLNRLIAMTADGVTQEMRYDALGNLVETGYHDGKAYKALTRFGFDGAGRQVWAASPLGILQYSRYDTEGQLLESGRADSRMAQVRHYAYDSYGRLTEAKDGRGMRVAIEYDERGRPVRFFDAFGRPHESVPRQHGDGGMSIRRLADDFGRVIATISPDSGTTLQQFDEAGHVIGSTDAQGNRATYEYDVAGRIMRQAITDKNTGQAGVTVWRYQGRHLVALDHPSQSEQYRYDERGLLVARTVRIKRSNGSDITSITRYAYGDDGVLQSVSLPDGSRIEYERNGQGQVVAVKRGRIQTGWLQWLLPAKTLVADLQRDLVGTKHYKAGNGIEADYQRSREGVLARIVYRHSDDRPSALPKTASALDWLIAAANASEPSGKPASQPEPSPLPGALGLPEEPKAFLDLRYLWDAQGNLLHLQQKAGAPAAGNYAYDREDRLIAAVQTENQTVQASRYFYDAQGRRLLSQQGIAEQGDLKTNTEKALYQAGTHRWLGQDRQTSEFDVNGQPQRIGERAYRWDALGRMLEVRQGDKTLARYTYNHRGERIAKDSGGMTYYLYHDKQLAAELDGQGSLKRQYVYLADQPVAVIDTPQGTAPQGEERDAVSRIAHDLATILHAWFADDEKTVWLHANHLGAIEAATAQDGALVWRARYQPSGQASIVSHGFTLNLRLPGQYEDAETGLFYNGRRYYDPQGGRYLTPDPLGTPDGPNPYAYVAHNPLRYIDPSGLALFAFDGTGNTNDQVWLNDNGSSLSNVWQFRQLYEDGNRRYVTGVGTVHKDAQYGDIKPADYVPWYVPLSAQNADMGGNYSGPARIQRVIQYFNDEADLVEDDSSAMDVDVVGFSRGAAEARDFANRIVANTKNGWYSYKVRDGHGAEMTKCQKVNFRFMGLYDTVLSTNYSGQSYNLAVPDAFAYVAQAVALNEYRGALTHPYLSTGAFPLESIMPGMFNPVPEPGKTRVERGFIGAHADIGGGFGANDSQLAQVALTWMVKQAETAGVKMSAVPSTIIANPVIHDKSGSILTGAPAPGAEDRAVKYGNGATTKQRQMVFSTGMSWSDTQQFIQYLPENDPQRPNFITGTVDMNGYLQWLRGNGYDINLTAQ